MLGQPIQSSRVELTSRPNHFQIFSESTNIIVRTIRLALRDDEENHKKNRVTPLKDLMPYIDTMKRNIAGILTPNGQSTNSNQNSWMSPAQIQEDKDNAILAEVDNMLGNIVGIDGATTLIQSLGDAFSKSPRVLQLRTKFRDKATELIPLSSTFHTLETVRVPLYPYIGQVNVIINFINKLLEHKMETLILDKEAIIQIRTHISVELGTIQQNFQEQLTGGLNYREERELVVSLLDICRGTIDRLSKVSGITDNHLASIRVIMDGLSDDLSALDTINNPNELIPGYATNNGPLLTTQI